MPTRTINLKLIQKNTEEGKQLSRALWTTHSLLNEAIAQIESTLLLCRGKSYNRLNKEGERELVRSESVQKQLLEFARAVQERNDSKERGSDKEVLAIMAEFYQDLVPSVLLDADGNPLKGNAQTSANTWSGPIYDPESEGGLKVFDRIVDPLPKWIAMKESDDPDWEKESIEWLDSPEAKKARSATGRPSGWILRLRDGVPWQDNFIEDQLKKQKDVKGTPLLMKSMRDYGLLPILKPMVFKMLDISGSKSSKTRWDTLAIRLAIEHLLSWESWNHRAHAEHLKVRKKVESQAKQLEKESSEGVDMLRQYEQQRHEQLEKVSFASEEKFRINTRMIRGWNRIQEAMTKNGKTEASRLKILNELQTTLGGGFGDPDLFRWIARDGREVLWKFQDLVPKYAIANNVERLRERTKDCALYTPPHESLHPRFVQYEALGGSNLYNYKLIQSGNQVQVELKLLFKDLAGGLEQKEFTVPLAPSGQFTKPRLETTKKKQRVCYFSSNQMFKATMGGAFILLDRDYLQNRILSDAKDESIGDVWLKVTIDVDSQAPSEWLDGKGRVATPSTVHHFKTALSNKSKHHDKLEPGLRVLSVDLGMRQFAACSVFELVWGKPSGGTFFSAVPEKDLWAKQERSFLLRLPGENPKKSERLARENAFSELKLLKRRLYRLKSIVRLSALEDRQARTNAIEDIRKALDEEIAKGIDPGIPFDRLRQLLPHTEKPNEVWKHEVNQVYRSMERDLAEAVSDWRRRTRPRQKYQSRETSLRDYAPGKSAWALEYLDQVRRFLAGWSRHGRQYEQVNRASREKQGAFASSLLSHINGLKDDRIKSGVDMIIQAARGFEPRQHSKGWIKKHEPCRVILFEDLARYRFRTDRPRRENAQLMKWAHREIISEAKLQAEIYGVIIETVGAGFSSRFHGRTMAPGVRAHRITSEDLEDCWMRNLLERQRETLDLPSKHLAPGNLIPWDGGEWFVTLGNKGNSFIENADINAAVNLQRRFWTRYADAYLLTAVPVTNNEKTAYYPRRINARLKGSLAVVSGGSGYVKLVERESNGGFEIESITKVDWSRYSDGPEAETDTQEDPIGEELEGEAEAFSITGAPTNFLRDASGLVMPEDGWFPAKDYWGQVKWKISRALLA